MPLVTITTTPNFHPCSSIDKGTVIQKMIGDFGRHLPGLFVGNAKKLYLDQDTPLEGVQVSHRRTHAQDVNAPNVWILVQFSEAKPPKKVRKQVSRQLRKLIENWFANQDQFLAFNIALDCFWGPSHGFFSINGTSAEW